MSHPCTPTLLVAQVSSLMLRLEALAAKKLLVTSQLITLRTLAWGKDLSLLRTYEEVGALGLLG